MSPSKLWCQKVLKKDETWTFENMNYMTHTLIAFVTQQNCHRCNTDSKVEHPGQRNDSMFWQYSKTLFNPLTVCLCRIYDICDIWIQIYPVIQSRSVITLQWHFTTIHVVQPWVYSVWVHTSIVLFEMQLHTHVQWPLWGESIGDRSVPLTKEQ